MGSYGDVTQLMKLLAHPARLQIMETLLEDGEACVCHLEAALGQRQAYISQQLRLMKEGGLIKDRREGHYIYYSTSHPSVGELIGLANGLAGAIKGRSPAGSDRKPTVDCPCPKCEHKFRT